MSFEQRLPSAFQQLVAAREAAERHFRDVCDLEFSVQHGQLYVLHVRRARRTSLANLRFALQFLVEGKIGPQDVLRRVSPSDIAAWLLPVLENSDNLRFLGNGFPACGGVATGKVFFRAADVIKSAADKTPAILVQTEIAREDFQAIQCAKGVLTTRGGMSSHAALISRQIGKPCVCGFSPTETTLEGYGDVRSLFRAGSWITINGLTGDVFEGKAKCKTLRWRDHPELTALSELVAGAVSSGNVPMDAVGQTWRMADFFAHASPLSRGSSGKNPIRETSFTSFESPSAESLKRIQQSLTPLRHAERNNYGEILLSLMDSQSRILSSLLGIGNHPRYFRPMWDPKESVCRKSEDEGTQLVGMEFFGINRHVPFLVDIATITILLEMDVHSKNSEWFLDFTNPEGEGLVVGSESVRAYRLLINNAEVQHDDVPLFYDSLRRREYQWTVFEQNGTSHREVVKTVAQWASGKPLDERVLPLCYELGLIRDRALTIAGESLLDGDHRNKRMNSQKNSHLDRATRTLDAIISTVVERGYDEKSESTDDYAALLVNSFEHRKLVIFQLYDSYFPPKRHEFELQLLTSVVETVSANPIAQFLGGAVGGGVAYDILKYLLTQLVAKTKPIKRTHDGFMEIESHADQLMEFFKTRDQASMAEICDALDTEANKVEPLLKLLGFRCRRKGKRRVWLAPHAEKPKPTGKSK